MRLCLTVHVRASSSHIVYGRSSRLVSYNTTSPFWRCFDIFESDLIIVLKEGAVVEQGTHEELIRAGGLYYSMWQEQAADNFSDYSPAVVE
jgi:hypothetical protein